MLLGCMVSRKDEPLNGLRPVRLWIGQQECVCQAHIITAASRESRRADAPEHSLESCATGGVSGVCHPAHQDRSTRVRTRARVCSAYGCQLSFWPCYVPCMGGLSKLYWMLVHTLPCMLQYGLALTRHLGVTVDDCFEMAS
jgi:hypothetical protein